MNLNFSNHPLTTKEIADRINEVMLLNVNIMGDPFERWMVQYIIEFDPTSSYADDSMLYPIPS
jgi:hypothetical protein